MKILKRKTKNYNAGAALLELLLYITLFSIFSLLIIDSLVVMTKSFKETSINREFSHGADIVEVIERDIRQAYDLTLVGPGDLKLNIKDGNETEKTVEFLLSDSSVQLIEDDVLTGNLNAPGLIVTDLVFSPITTTMGKAVTFSLTVEVSDDSSGNAIDFNNTVVLRGSY